jgi:ATP-binding cassette subfamily B protein RaxB
MRRNWLTAAKHACTTAIHQVRTVHHCRATIEPQVEPADCGYVSISAVMSLFGRRLLVDEIKSLTGTTTRGLTLRQVRDGLRACGADAEVIAFDVTRREAYPDRGLVLLTRGHYIVIAGRRGDRFEIFDPGLGWGWTTLRKLARGCCGLGVDAPGLSAPAPPPRTEKRGAGLPIPLKLVLGNRSGRLALAWFAMAQLLVLALPLLSMWSVDRSVKGLSVGTIGAVSIGFMALSLTNILISLSGELLHNRSRRFVSVALSRVAFDSLAQKPADWFERGSAASLQNRMGSLNAQLDFYLNAVKSLGSVTATFAIGLAALLFISPWLLLPGLCSLALSGLLDLLFQRGQRDSFGSAVEASQRRQGFVLDTLAQLPLIARFGAVRSTRIRYASLVRAATMAEARLQALRGWRTALGGLAKSGDTLFFVIISASLMGAGHFTIGGFVALGAYKDLLASSVGSLFQLAMQRESQKVHELQSAALLTSGGCRERPEVEVTRGEVVLSDVFFRYGSLERPILTGANLHARAGECTVIRGPSGTGKSTLAKLMVGALTPTAGSVMIDGRPIAHSMAGMAAVLQGDRLIGGSIRDNITMFRRGVDDSAILEALKKASVDDFVLSLPMGLNTFVAEGVGGLSGGQRQRLLIARALLQAPRLVVLDEATSSLEVDIEARILEALASSGTTTIIIAHRPEVWRLADRIYSVDADGLVEEVRLGTGRGPSQTVVQSASLRS